MGTLAELKSSLAESDKDINKLETEKESLTNSLSFERKEKAKVEQDLQGTVAEVSELKASQEEILGENSNLKANVAELDARIKGLQIQVAEVSELKASQEEILSENSNLKANVAELDARIKGLQNEISTVTDAHE